MASLLKQEQFSGIGDRGQLPRTPPSSCSSLAWKMCGGAGSQVGQG